MVKKKVAVARFMHSERSPDRGSAITGISTHNQRIERPWRDHFVECASFFVLLLSLGRYWLLYRCEFYCGPQLSRQNQSRTAKDFGLGPFALALAFFREDFAFALRLLLWRLQRQGLPHRPFTDRSETIKAISELFPSVPRSSVRACLTLRRKLLCQPLSRYSWFAEI